MKETYGYAENIPLQEKSSDRLLMFVLVIMTFLSTLALTSFLITLNLTNQLENRLVDQATIQILPETGKNKKAETLDILTAAVIETLKNTPGIEKIEIVNDEEMGALLSPWLNIEMMPKDISVPRLIKLQTNLKQLDENLIAAKLQNISSNVVWHSHQSWIQGLVRFSHIIMLIALATMVLILLTAAFLIILTTRSGMNAHRDVIQILMMIGAKDSYIARQFASHTQRQAWRGSITGFGLFLITALLLYYGIQQLPDSFFMPDFSWSWHWLAIIIIPLVMMALTRQVAVGTVMKTLKEQ